MRKKDGVEDESDFYPCDKDDALGRTVKYQDGKSVVDRLIEKGHIKPRKHKGK